MQHLDPVATVAILLAVALVGGMIAHRLRQPIILGYLLVGIAVGPHALGLVGDLEIVEAAAAIGVALLMFALGLVHQTQVPELVSGPDQVVELEVGFESALVEGQRGIQLAFFLEDGGEVTRTEGCVGRLVPVFGDGERLAVKGLGPCLFAQDLQRRSHVVERNGLSVGLVELAIGGERILVTTQSSFKVSFGAQNESFLKDSVGFGCPIAHLSSRETRPTVC